MTTLTISLPESLRAFVTKQIRAKGFGNVSEYFRTLIRKAQEQEANAKLESLLLAGLNSGQASEPDQRFWKDLRAEATQLIKKHRKVPK